MGYLGFPKETNPLFLANSFLFLHREAAEGFTLAAEPGLPAGHAVLAGTDGGYANLSDVGNSRPLSILGFLREEGGSTETWLYSVTVAFH